MPAMLEAEKPSRWDAGLAMLSFFQQMKPKNVQRHLSSTALNFVAIAEPLIGFGMRTTFPSKSDKHFAFGKIWAQPSRPRNTCGCQSKIRTGSFSATFRHGKSNFFAASAKLLQQFCGNTKCAFFNIVGVGNESPQISGRGSGDFSKFGSKSAAGDAPAVAIVLPAFCSI